MRILLTGALGQLGTDLLPLLKQQGEVVAVDRAECDLCSGEAIRKLVADVQPSVIVNTAAYTAVNEAEAQPDPAYALNRDAAGTLAEEARKLGAMFVHYSTDYVFDGNKAAAYTEADGPAPLNVYGASKLAGERAVAAAGGRYLVLRTSWVYGANGNNFIRQYSPLPEPEFPSGLYHTTADGRVSWCGFARAIVEALGETETFKLKQILAIAASEFPTPARRPLNSVLCNSKFEKTFGFKLESWQLGLAEVVREIHLRESHS
jgi:dTDP-4-dehydrorhamnose reductase